MWKSIPILAGLVLIATDAQADPAKAELETLNGTFVSPGVEQWYGGYGKREFVFRDGTWSLIFTHAVDQSMTQRTFQFRTGGAYEVGESSAVGGAYEAVFGEDWKHVTLLTSDPDLTAAMGLAECGLTVNLETDISESGCAAWKSVAECSLDHDLLALTPEGLHLGVRPADNDMCTPDRRPAALLPPVVRLVAM